MSLRRVPGTLPSPRATKRASRPQSVMAGHSTNARAEAIASLKSEVLRIAHNGTRQGFKFAQRMFDRFPELRGA